MSRGESSPRPQGFRRPQRPRRVLVLNQSALPRSQGGGTRHVELFGRLSRWSHRIVAGNRNYTTRERFSSRSPAFVTVPVPNYESNGPGRVLNWLAYAVGALVAGLRSGRYDVVYASSPPLLTPLAGRLLAWLRRVPFVLEIRDLWPRSMVELGYLADGSRTHRMLVALEGFVYRSADVIVAVADGWQDHFAAFGVRPEKVVLISNGAEPADFVPTVSRDKARADLGADGFVAVYAGAHGPANGLDLVLDAAGQLSGCTFFLVGDGLDKARLVTRAREEGIGNVRFLPAVPKEQLANVFVAADVGLHTLAQAELFKEALSPNKLYDYLAAGLPVVTNVGGDLERRLVEAGCAVRGSAEPGEPSLPALVAALRGLGELGADERARMGARGRAYVERHVSRTVMAARLEALLDDAIGR
ncbi:glycosyltransferase family 4 protein [Actinopolymorpha singaporensis]|uniref:Glycosyltransferase involved in cell wall bisynthesis n=1 Tax=Actinopolymorpha singaporensis TaxID=117157 RepID=A0A1H1LWU8_9ACTN|nr:glycosyltransferase family 4 protein [Actinopolymorpha singaporensis]SDR78545.1 Glycosyltransferase involved in cell wall bisynthesis [Actinopolymorpha singaporensis]